MTDTLSFDSLGLSAKALSSLTRAGYERPTPIQQRALPPALGGRDVVGCAATGTGKTAAFVLPIIERLEGKKGTRALVLAPTRELATQIAEHVEMFGQGRGVRGAVVIGGVGMGPQVHALRNGFEVVIATPGRLNDHLDQGTAKLNGIEILVLDEADRMLDMGFKPQLERILAHVPKQRQTMLFSATMAGEVASFAGRHLRDPAKVEVARSGTVAERADQRVFFVPTVEKSALLLALLEEDQESTLVFTRTRRRADRICQVLDRAGHEVARIHADRSQGQRRTALEGFKSGKYRILVATDIAARGIDVEDIGHVVNYDLPDVPEDYVHRVGRTARASASGRASSFCSPEERENLRDIEKLTRVQIREEKIPRDSPIFKEAMARKAEAAANAPPQRHFQGPRRHGQRGGPQRSQGQPQGGAEHRKPKSQHAHQEGAQKPRPQQGHGAGGQQQQPPHKPKLVGSFRPRRRR
ncbi:MAG: DEAD/DEAH box helicase [Myxococcales bacterium]